MAASAGSDKKQDCVLSANIERLDESHRADDDDYASETDSGLDRRPSWDEIIDEFFQDYDLEDFDGPYYTGPDPTTMPPTDT